MMMTHARGLSLLNFMDGAGTEAVSIMTTAP
jgi:hypothetical protein